MSGLPKTGWEVREIDCIDALAGLPDASVDTVITDPPYGININNNAWDRPHIQPGERSREPAGLRYERWCEQWLNQCSRVLKPGGHLASFGSPRNVHRLTSAAENTGLEIRDVLLWLHGQGYPKTHNLTGTWQGWGTGLKPAYEPILLARRGLDGRVLDNVNEHGTGAIHIDACRAQDGRWPTNLLLSHSAACTPRRCDPGCPIGALGDRSRFFYCAKPSRRERDGGCEQLPRRTIQTFKIGRKDEEKAKRVGTLNVHPTVKPLDLMRWLVKLLCPPGGLVLDPFTGSGTTGAATVLEHQRFLGFETDHDYAHIARHRIHHHANQSQCRTPARRHTNPTRVHNTIDQ